jgi:hypothetical protein
VTIPSNIIFPLHSEKILSKDPKDLERYLRELIYTLQTMYEDLAQGVNGDIRSSASSENSRWIPRVKDSANSGTTFTYDHQIGWVYRKGIFVDVWFDVKWTANSGAITGNMYVELPYKVVVTAQMPFVGKLQTSGITYDLGTDCVLNGISDTYRAEVWNDGSGVTTANQSSTSSGRLIGHIRYMGQQDE